MTMLYHDDPDWYEKPGGNVEIPLGSKATRSRSFVVPPLPWIKAAEQEERKAVRTYWDAMKAKNIDVLEVIE